MLSKKSRKGRVEISWGWLPGEEWERTSTSKGGERREERNMCFHGMEDTGADLTSGPYGDKAGLKGGSERQSLMPKKEILCLMQQTIVISRFYDEWLETQDWWQRRREEKEAWNDAGTAPEGRDGMKKKKWVTNWRTGQDSHSLSQPLFGTEMNWASDLQP